MEILVKNTLKFLGIFAVVVLAGFSIMGCGSTPAAAPVQAEVVETDAEPQLKTTVTGIDEEFDGKFAWINFDTGSSRNDPTVAYGMGTIKEGSVTINILDHETDLAYYTTGNYFVLFLIYEDLDSAGNGEEPLWQGFIMSKDIEEDTSINLSEFIKL